MHFDQTSPDPVLPRSPVYGRVAIAAALVAVELLLISLIYQHNFTFTCKLYAPNGFCSFASRIVPRALSVVVAAALFAWARPQAARLLLSRGARIAPLALGLNALGFLMVLAPWPFLSDDSASAVKIAGTLSWVVGGIVAAIGFALVLAPWTNWRALLGRHGPLLGLLLVVGTFLPEITDQLRPLWDFDTVKDITFRAVIWVMELVGYDVYSDTQEKIIGAKDFFVRVGPSCSGVEGFALITAFSLLYMTLFRADLRFPNAFLLLPLGIVASWLFNTLRISVLLSIGAEFSPELAVGGFHSHAGWLSFTTLAIVLIVLSRNVGFFMKPAADAANTAPHPLPPFFRDRNVAEILPFAVFMLSALLASTFAQSPGLVYPLRAVLMAGVLALFWPVLRGLPWRLDPLALFSGVAIGIAWIATAPAAAGPPPFGALGGVALAGWVVARIIGTALLVPVIEELMFRGYLLRRIAPQGGGWRMGLAIAISAGLFALLHDRWLAAALAGVVFGLLVWRSRNLTDAIVSHASANAVIAAWALATGAWHII